MSEGSTKKPPQPNPEGPSHVKMQTYIALRNMGEALKPALAAQAAAQGLALGQEELERSGTYISFNSLWKGAPRPEVTIGPVDRVGFSDINTTEGDMVDIGLELFSDGSPFAFDADLDLGNEQPNLYHLILMPEVQPFLVHSRRMTPGLRDQASFHDKVREYLADVAEGTEPAPYYLTDVDCESVVAAFTEAQPVLEHQILY